jgi:hypothetical protein
VESIDSPCGCEIRSGEREASIRVALSFVVKSTLQSSSSKWAKTSTLHEELVQQQRDFWTYSSGIFYLAQKIEEQPTFKHHHPAHHSSSRIRKSALLLPSTTTTTLPSTIMSTLLLLFNLFSTIALALPFNSTACPIEDLPWTINNLVVFTAAPANHTTATSPIDFIAFDFCDINAGLELETSCFHETNGTTALENPVHYYLCEDGDVRFRWTGRSLQIARAYRSEW